MSSTTPQSVLVLGAGNFGTCLAQHLTTNGHTVTIWSIEDDVVNSINEKHRNPKYLSSAILSERVKATNKISQELLTSVRCMVIALPTQVIRSVLESIKDLISNDLLIVCAAKGLEISSRLLPTEIICDVLGESRARGIVALSGPSFAVEIMEQQPTAVAVASKNLVSALAAQQLFHTPRFRVYTSDDPTGLEIAGALKNVIAIASGAVSGLGFQNNTRAAILTRGLAEIMRMGVARGANPLTFNGLGGVGDLFLTCTSEKSRNYTVGMRLGKNEPLDHVLNTMTSVAEGVYTAKAVHELASRLNVAMPICEQVYQVLYERKSVADAVNHLLNREPKAELG